MKVLRDTAFGKLVEPYRRPSRRNENGTMLCLAEARASLDWLFHDAETMRVINDAGKDDLIQTTDKIITLIRGTTAPWKEARQVGAKMLEAMPHIERLMPGWSA